mmetsp:Transcript_38697/g.63660  ORF Transcript_38697/g.63660 Transcript_38697/m.63660 type:complete len:101 (+) Transcript_38697:282-584(+)
MSPGACGLIFPPSSSLPVGRGTSKLCRKLCNDPPLAALPREPEEGRLESLALARGALHADGAHSEGCGVSEACWAEAVLAGCGHGENLPKLPKLVDRKLL